MKKVILSGTILAVIGLLAALTVPAFAHGSDNSNATSTGNQAWEDMYQACQNGNWEAMEEAHDEVFGEDNNNMPYQGGYNDNGNMPYQEGYNGNNDENGETSSQDWNGMGGQTGGDMMDGGWGGMMGGGMMR